MDGFSHIFSFAARSLTIAGKPESGVVSVWMLAIIFAVSGYTKLRRPTLTAMAIVDFGLHTEVRPTLGVLVGLGELIVALGLIAGLLTGKAFWAVVFLATVLFWFFLGLISRSLLAGERFKCFCFGDSGSELSSLTALRTLILAVLATNLLRISGLSEIPTTEYVFGLVAAAGMLGGTVLLFQIPTLLRGGDFTRHRELS